jgi:hypothetical protein
VLSIYLGLVVLVRVVFGLVILGAGPWLVFVTDKELVEDLQQLLYLIHTLNHFVLLADLSGDFLAALILSVTVEEVLLHLPLAVVSSTLGRGGVASLSP